MRVPTKAPSNTGYATSHLSRGIPSEQYPVNRCATRLVTGESAGASPSTRLDASGLHRAPCKRCVRDQLRGYYITCPQPTAGVLSSRSVGNWTQLEVIWMSAEASEW